MLQQLRVAPGTLVVAAAWQWTGVGVAMLALVLVALLLWVGTYAAELGAAADPDAVAEPGPLFWPHLVCSGVVMWAAWS